MKQYRDSNSYTERYYIQNLRSMDIEKRLKICFELNKMAIEICKAGILNQNPGIAEEEFKKELKRRLSYDSRRYIHKGNK